MHALIERYNTKVLPQLKSEKEYKSPYEIPHITKVVVNMGIGDYMTDSKAVDQAMAMLGKLTGQKPVVLKARKAISGFKIRTGMPIGLKVTLRGKRMNDFLFKLIEIGLPRTRDFRGLKRTSVTAAGILNIGIRDSQIFPDLPLDTPSYSLQVTVSSTAKTKEESFILYENLGFFFQSDNEIVAPRKKKGRTYHKSSKK
jgi:large subunit ribosomal protein L5